MNYAKKILFATAIISTALFVSACTADQTGSTSNTTSNPSANSQSSTSASVSISGTQAAGTSQQTHNVSNDDQIAYQVAQQLKDASSCSKIKDQDYQKQCISAVDDAKLTDQALAQNDASICDKESTPDAQDACKVQIDVTKAQSAASQEKAMEAQQIAAENQNTMNNALQTQNPALCDGITDPNAKAACQFDIYSPMAKQKNDPSLCKKISDVNLQNECEQNLQKK